MTYNSLESGSYLWISAITHFRYGGVFILLHACAVFDTYFYGTESHVVLGLFNMWTQLMLQMQNITWMVKFYLVVN